MGSQFWEDYSFVIRGRQRRRLLALLEEPKTPTELKKEARMSLTNVSRTLVLFEKAGLARCLTPKQKLGRVYAITDRGGKVRSKLLAKEK